MFLQWQEERLTLCSIAIQPIPGSAEGSSPQPEANQRTSQQPPRPSSSPSASSPPQTKHQRHPQRPHQGSSCRPETRQERCRHDRWEWALLHPPHRSQGCRHDGKPGRGRALHCVCPHQRCFWQGRKSNCLPAANCKSLSLFWDNQRDCIFQGIIFSDHLLVKIVFARYLNYLDYLSRNLNWRTGFMPWKKEINLI